MSTGSGRWPDGKQAAISFTMDNMGEAAALYRGTWPEGKTIGLHPSVTRDLPKMLRILDETKVRATYFVEAWNTGVYPNAIQVVRRNRHEIAFHGWQHEPWGDLTIDHERALFERSLSAFNRLNLRMYGFRPPGGRMTRETPDLVRTLGFSYCSPAGSHPAFQNDVVYLPFEWQGIDAYYYSDAFSGLRSQKGDPREVQEPANLESRMTELIETKLDEGGYSAVLFHPHLETSDEQLAVMRRIIERLRDDDRIWLAPCFEVAAWVREHPAEFSDDPELDLTTWTR
jgi:peptidoglycan/xylan/chitin deacetylase (PgdA/CDA1 family)